MKIFRMRNILILFVASCFVNAGAQVGELLPGQLVVSGSVSVNQDVNDILGNEAGLDDKVVNADSTIKLEYTLNAQGGPIGLNSTQMCSNNIYLYRVYLHSNAPNDIMVEAQTLEGSGTAIPPYPLGPSQATLYPGAATYDASPLPDRTLTSSSASFVEIPNDAQFAKKIFEFVGCRTQIPINFRVTSGVSAPNNSSVDIYYTIVGSLLQ